MSRTIENKNIDIETKLNDLEARNSQLEANFSMLASRSSLLAPDSINSTDEIDLKEFWNAIWAGKWLIIAITSLFAVASFFTAISLPNEYKSTVLLAPASQSSAGRLSKLAGEFGGLASLAGISLGGSNGDDKVAIAIELVKTWGFLEKFISDNNIHAEVFAVKGWTRSTDTLIYDVDLYDIDSRQWLRNFNPDKGETAEPSSWELYEELTERIDISQDKVTGFIRLSVEYYSPRIAKEWVDKLVVAINAHIQKQDREEAAKNIEYLKSKIQETNIADMQSVFYQLIEEQLKTLMLAEVSDEYVFKTLSSAKIAEEKSKPKRAMICILGVILGGALSSLILLVRFVRNR